MKRIILSISLLFLLIVKMFAQVESEPNNFSINADTIILNDLTGVIYGAINPDEDEDFYLVHISEEGVFNISIDDIPQGMNLRAQLFDSSENLLDQENDDDDFDFNHLVCDTGIYYVRVLDISVEVDESPDFYELTINLDTLDIYECNNDFDEAAPVEIGDEILAQINSDGDEDFYSVHISEEGVFNISIDDIPQGMNLRAQLFDSSENLLNQENDDDDFDFNHLVCDTGIYYVRVLDISVDVDESSGFYKLIISIDNLDIYECNNDFAEATPIEICDTIYASVNLLFDDDYFLFNLSDTQPVNVQLTNIDDFVRPKCSIFSSTQNLIGEKTGEIGEDLFFTFTPPSTGDYFLLIESAAFPSSQLYELILDNSNCITTKINSINTLPNFIVYPNPTSDIINIELGEYQFENFILRIYDLRGALILVLPNDSKKLELDIQELPKGMYFLELESNKSTVLQKIIKQ